MLATMILGAVGMTRLHALPTFSFFGSAMLAEPPVPEVKEVIGLVHPVISDLKFQISKRLWYLVSQKTRTVFTSKPDLSSRLR